MKAKEKQLHAITKLVNGRPNGTSRTARAKAKKAVANAMRPHSTKNHPELSA
jgi:hypothetical protein